MYMHNRYTSEDYDYPSHPIQHGHEGRAADVIVIEENLV